MGRIKEVYRILRILRIRRMNIELNILLNERILSEWTGRLFVLL